jgi:imidazoleglycerol-phosphate dehydratase
LGLEFLEGGEEKARVVRTTRESRVEVGFEPGRLNDQLEAYEKDIKTGIPFFNHMLYGLATRALFKLSAKFEQTAEKAPCFAHVITEDTGLTLGAAVRAVIDARIEKGVEQRGFFQVAFDDGLACVTLAFDGRPYCYFVGRTRGLEIPIVEGMEASTLRQFFEGFAIGAGANVVIECREPSAQWQDGHHAWEATFKAFGEALRQSIAYCPEKAKRTIGLKGTGMEGK